MSEYYLMIIGVDWVDVEEVIEVRFFYNGWVLGIVFVGIIDYLDVVIVIVKVMFVVGVMFIYEWVFILDCMVDLFVVYYEEFV